jgi:hypothetical protein
MIKVIQMTLEEFSANINTNRNWNNLLIGDIFVDKNKSNKWAAYEVTDIKHGYGNSEPELVEYSLQII